MLKERSFGIRHSAFGIEHLELTLSMGSEPRKYLQHPRSTARALFVINEQPETARYDDRRSGS